MKNTSRGSEEKQSVWQLLPGLLIEMNTKFVVISCKEQLYTIINRSRSNLHVLWQIKQTKHDYAISAATNIPVRLIEIIWLNIWIHKMINLRIIRKPPRQLCKTGFACLKISWVEIRTQIFIKDGRQIKIISVTSVLNIPKM